MELSKRLQAVVNLLGSAETVADVGCDHGFVAIHLVEQKIAKHVIAMDVHKGPLLRAHSHIVQAELSNQITLRLSDGLQDLRLHEADAMILAGVGGALTIRILSEGESKIRGMTHCILQPQSELRDVRKYLRENHYAILQEDMIYEDGKYYPMMKVSLQYPAGTAREVEEEVLDTEDEYGPCLLEQRHPVLLQYLCQEDKRISGILDEMSAKMTGDDLQINARMKERYDALIQERNRIRKLVEEW